MSIGTARRDRLRALANRIRAIPGEGYGIRPYSVSVITMAYSGAELGEGNASTEETPITVGNGQPPKVRNLTSEEIAVGGYDKQTWEIGPITPLFSAGGVDILTLTQSSIGTETEPHFVLTGPEFPSGANFRAVRVQSDKALHYTIQVQRVADG